MSIALISLTQLLIKNQNVNVYQNISFPTFYPSISNEVAYLNAYYLRLNYNSIFLKINNYKNTFALTFFTHCTKSLNKIFSVIPYGLVKHSCIVKISII